MPQTRAAIYLRQDIESEVRDEVERAARAREFEPVRYDEQRGTRRRSALERLRAEARGGRLAAVFVSCLSDLGRRFDCATAVLELLDLRVAVLSVAEPWVAEAPPDLLTSFMRWVASEQKAHHIAKTKLGMEKARRRGVHLGRPRLAPEKLHAAAALIAPGVSQRAAARAAGISEAALRAYLKQRAAAEVLDPVATVEERFGPLSDQPLPGAIGVTTSPT